MSSNLVTKNQIILKKADLNDFDFFYSIKSEESNIYWTGHDKKPDFKNLKLWYNDQIISEKRTICIIHFNNIKIGYCYLDVIPFNTIELSIAICEKYQNKGFGSLALQKIIQDVEKKFKTNYMIAWILDNNEHSKRLFIKNKFVASTETKSQHLPLDKKDYLMRKYVLKGK